MAIFGREHLDGDKLRLVEDRLYGNVSFPHAHIRNPHIAVGEPGSLFLDGPRLPSLVVLTKPRQDRPLHRVVLVLAHIPLLNLPADVFRIRLIRSLQILFERDLSRGYHRSFPSRPVYALRDESALAIALKAPVYTTEQAWKDLKVGVPIHVIR